MNTPAETSSPPGYDVFFGDLAGGRLPYAYQRRVAWHLLETSKDILLTAPTGSGKTWAALAPFLFARKYGRPIADRVLYALPLRALATSLQTEVAETVTRLGLDACVTIQTGDHPEDELFDRGDIIFTTIDQLLSAYLHLPLSLPRRLANLNCGALVGSLIVFDEVHLLEPERALQTMLHLLESHETLARFILATATLTQAARSKLHSKYGGRLVEEAVMPGETERIPALAQKRRAWTRSTGPVSPTAVHELHRGTQTLVIVNTVGTAQALGRELAADPPADAQIVVLHSRMRPGDRASAERRVSAAFGPRAKPENIIVVATQVVEAGLDLSADVLLTELAPANALLQRAGRCARYATPRNEGHVVVFDLARDASGARRVGPYREARSIIDATWAALDSCDMTVLDHAGELRILEAGLASAEDSMFGHLTSHAARRQRDEEITTAWRDGDLSAVRRLVRDAQSVAVVLSDAPESIDVSRGPAALTIPIPTWRGFIARTSAAGSLGGVLALTDTPTEESATAVRWTWEPFRADAWADMYCLTSAVAGYDDLLGLLLVPSDRSMPPVAYRDRPLGPRFHYRRETYHDHVVRVLRQARGWLQRHVIGVSRCADRYRLDPKLVEAAVLIAAGLHDTAKLGRAWQDAAHRWQQFKSGDSSQELLAHTDFNPSVDADAERQPKFRRPNHAVEGALAVVELVDGWIDDLGCSDSVTGEALRRIVTSAIARHHSPLARQHGDFDLVDNALDELLAPFGHVPDVPRPITPRLVTSPSAADRRLFEDHGLLDPDMHKEWWPLYSFVVRGLRLSDQAGTKEGAMMTSGEACSWQ